MIAKLPLDWCRPAVDWVIISTPASKSGPILANVPWRRFAVVCDTFTAGLKGSAPDEPCRPWGGSLAAALRKSQPDLAYLNLCKENLVSSQARSRQLQRMLDFSPDLAAVGCGYDDILNNVLDVDHFESELARILMALRQIDCTVLTIGIFDVTRPDVMPSARRRQIRDQIDLVCARTAAVARRFGAINLDLSAYARPDGSRYSDDGRRLNGRGHAVVTAEAIRQIGRYLGNARPGQQPSP
jgi:hypothetical protein